MHYNILSLNTIIEVNLERVGDTLKLGTKQSMHEI